MATQPTAAVFTAVPATAIPAALAASALPSATFTATVCSIAARRTSNASAHAVL